MNLQNQNQNKTTKPKFWLFYAQKFFPPSLKTKQTFPFASSPQSSFSIKLYFVCFEYQKKNFC